MPRSNANLSPLQKRIRAAYAVGGYGSLDELAGDLSYGLSTLKRLELPGTNRRVTHARLQEIAELCNIPVEWLEEGWPEPTGAPEPEQDTGLQGASDIDALRALVSSLSGLRRDVAQLRAQLEAQEKRLRLVERVGTGQRPGGPRRP